MHVKYFLIFKNENIKILKDILLKKGNGQFEETNRSAYRI